MVCEPFGGTLRGMYQVYEHGAVSLRELAESLGIVSASGGASVWAKKDAEPS